MTVDTLSDEKLAEIARPEHAHKTSLIIFDAVKGFIGGGMHAGRQADHDALPLFRFNIGASYYDEIVDVAIDIPDVEPCSLLAFHDWQTNALERRKLLLCVDGRSMPLATAIAFIAIRLGDAQRAYEQREGITT